MMTPLGEHALKIAARGLRVFPCIERGKEPAIHDNLRRATSDPNIVAGWRRARGLNIATGPSPTPGTGGTFENVYGSQPIVPPNPDRKPGK